jgi:hypothetical protein
MENLYNDDGFFIAPKHKNEVQVYELQNCYLH